MAFFAFEILLEDIRKDETDSVTGSGDLENSIASLAGRLRSDISNIITFSSEQLQVG